MGENLDFKGATPEKLAKALMKKLKKSFSAKKPAAELKPEPTPTVAEDCGLSGPSFQPRNSVGTACLPALSSLVCNSPILLRR